jgi:hypothetical protein
MATNFRTKIEKNLGTTPVTLATSGPASRLTVIGLSFANLTDGVVLISVKVRNEVGDDAFYIKNVILPPNQSLRVVNGGERLVLGTENSIIAFADQEDAVDVVMSFVEIV